MICALHLAATALVTLAACSSATTITSDAGGDAAGASTSCQVLGPVGFGGGDQCTVNLTTCSDGHAYRVNCSGSPALCTCEVDGTSMKNVAMSICGLTGPALVSTIDQNCGWTLVSK